MTLLVLDLKVPHLPQSADFAATVRSLTPLGFQVLTFTLSFVFVVIVWVNHHQVFHSINRSGRGLLWLNAHLLFWICLLPFPTAFVGEYPQAPVATMLLSLVLCGASVAFLLLVRHAAVGELFRPEISSSTRKIIMRRSWVGPPAFLITLVIALFSPPAALLSIFAVMAYYFVPARIRVSRTDEPS